MRASKKGNLVFGVILLAYIAYAALFILKSSFVVAETAAGNNESGERYFVLFDDAMISMRFAKNLAEGHGLVWNPGEERVEGYTNPLWTIWMAGLHLLPVAASKVSLLVQISGAVCILASLFFVRKIALDLARSELVSLLAVTLTAFYMPLNNWALLGMEVSLLVLLTTVAASLFLGNYREGRFSAWPYVLLGLGTLVRLDMAVPFLVSMVVLAFFDSKYRLTHLSWGLGILFISLGSQTVFRLAYYQDVFPNTYYLKVTGYPLHLRIARGFYALYKFVWDSNWLLMLLPFALLFFRRDPEIIFLLALVLGQAAYSVYVGGDAWEHRGGSNRYLAVVMPIFFILFTTAASLIFSTLAKFISSRRASTWSNAMLVVFILISMVNFNFLLGQDKSLERWVLIAQPMFSQGNRDYVEIARDLELFTTPQARLAVVAAGITPYFSGRPAIDLLGKSDRHIAHQPAHNAGSWTNLEEFRPGHMKWDYAYAIGELKPDLIVQLWGDTLPAEPFLEQEYVAGGSGSGLIYYLKKNSPNILWDRVEISSSEAIPEDR